VIRGSGAGRMAAHLRLPEGIKTVNPIDETWKDTRKWLLNFLSVITRITDATYRKMELRLGCEVYLAVDAESVRRC
jgi:hypothetical protein